MMNIVRILGSINPGMVVVLGVLSHPRSYTLDPNRSSRTKGTNDQERDLTC